MTRDTIPNSRHKSYSDQRQLAKAYNKNGIEYEVPRLLDATVGIFMEYVRTGQSLLPYDPLTFTHCQEQESSGNYQMVMGGFSLSGLDVFYSRYDDDVGLVVPEVPEQDWHVGAARPARTTARKAALV